MFRRTLVRCAQEARQPRIKFPDRKATHAESHDTHPHPAAPQDVAKNFDHFKEVFNSGPHFQPDKIQHATDSSASSSSAGKDSNSELAEDLHDLPKRFWQTPALAIEENEMDAIMSGGATLVQRP